MTFDNPIGMAASVDGLLAVLDRDGMRVCVESPHDLETAARGLAFSNGQLAMLVGDEIRRLGASDSISLPPGARAIAFAMSGSLLVGFPDRLARFGDRALEIPLPDGFDLRSLAVDAAGYWLGGAHSIVGLRPTADGVALRVEWPTSAPVRALTVGPDGSIYALAGADLLRNGEVAAQVDLVSIARRRRDLVGLSQDALVNLNEFVPTAPADRPDLELPQCDGGGAGDSSGSCDSGDS